MTRTKHPKALRRAPNPLAGREQARALLRHYLDAGSADRRQASAPLARPPGERRVERALATAALRLSRIIR